jgi:hypothetical protein
VICDRARARYTRINGACEENFWSARSVGRRAEDLGVERLEERYVRLEDQGPGRRFAYAAHAFDFTCVLAYDDAGLLLDYPGIAVRAA